MHDLRALENMHLRHAYILYTLLIGPLEVVKPRVYLLLATALQFYDENHVMVLMSPTGDVFLHAGVFTCDFFFGKLVRAIAL